MKINEIKAKIAELPPSKQEIANGLVDKLKFMDAELKKLQTAIKKKGPVEQYQNGPNQMMLKKTTEVDIYNNMIKNYNAIVKTLTEMLPETEATDGFDEWIAK